MSNFAYSTHGRRLDIKYSYTRDDVSLLINGIKAEPDYAEILEIEEVALNGVDIADLLSEEVLTTIVKTIRGEL